MRSLHTIVVLFVGVLTLAAGAGAGAAKRWQETGASVRGAYADPEAVRLPDGRYRLYYSVEPDVPGNRRETFSSVSRDGIRWQRESGVRCEDCVFPDVVRLPGGSWRMYFQRGGAIRSARSDNGLDWTDEDGDRVGASDHRPSVHRVAASSTLRLPNGTWLMVYRGNIDGKRYAPLAPNNSTTLLFHATSKDGLTWVKRGLALDSRNQELFGLVDGPELVRQDGSIRLYFWSYHGVYTLGYASGRFAKKPTLVFGDRKTFLRNPPGDPTVLRVGKQWRMWYGYHKRGIFSAVYR